MKKCMRKKFRTCAAAFPFAVALSLFATNAQAYTDGLASIGQGLENLKKVDEMGLPEVMESAGLVVKGAQEIGKVLEPVANALGIETNVIRHCTDKDNQKASLESRFNPNNIAWYEFGGDKQLQAVTEIAAGGGAVAPAVLARIMKEAVTTLSNRVGDQLKQDYFAPLAAAFVQKLATNPAEAMKFLQSAGARMQSGPVDFELGFQRWNRKECFRDCNGRCMPAPATFAIYAAWAHAGTLSASADLSTPSGGNPSLGSEDHGHSEISLQEAHAVEGGISKEELDLRMRELDLEELGITKEHVQAMAAIHNEAEKNRYDYLLGKQALDNEAQRDENRHEENTAKIGNDADRIANEHEENMTALEIMERDQREAREQARIREENRAREERQRQDDDYAIRRGKLANESTEIQLNHVNEAGQVYNDGVRARNEGYGLIAAPPRERREPRGFDDFYDK